MCQFATKKVKKVIENLINFGDLLEKTKARKEVSCASF